MDFNVSFRGKLSQQRKRGAPEKRGTGRPNSRMTSKQLRKFCPLDAESQALMKSAMDTLGLSARAHDRILRMARTIADLEGAENIREPHLTEAINYRTLDRKLWKR